MQGYPFEPPKFMTAVDAHTRPFQEPTNYQGRIFVPARPAEDMAMSSKPLDGVYKAEDHIPIMKTKPIERKFF